MPGFPTPFTYAINFLLFELTAVSSNWSLNPDTATPAGLAQYWFGLFRVRSPLLTESRLFSLPVGTEMFHFPTFPLSALYIQAEITRHYSGWVSPIRKSSDQSSFDSSPRLIAAYYVLHRLLMPRHPPCALNNLTTKMLASTV
ncbi:hypothetical protein EMGBS11_03980 [Actinomycetota bacterium]|nr:hypothetical protein EMGBS11_03980 [Actinomycetota bacterium]